MKSAVVWGRVRSNRASYGSWGLPRTRAKLSSADLEEAGVKQSETGGAAELKGVGSWTGVEVRSTGGGVASETRQEVDSMLDL